MTLTLTLTAIVLSGGITTSYSFTHEDCGSIPLKTINKVVEAKFTGWEAHSASTDNDGGVTFNVSIKKGDNFADISLECRDE